MKVPWLRRSVRVKESNVCPCSITRAAKPRVQSMNPSRPDVLLESAMWRNACEGLSSGPALTGSASLCQGATAVPKHLGLGDSVGYWSRWLFDNSPKAHQTVAVQDMPHRSGSISGLALDVRVISCPWD